MRLGDDLAVHALVVSARGRVVEGGFVWRDGRAERIVRVQFAPRREAGVAASLRARGRHRRRAAPAPARRGRAQRSRCPSTSTAACIAISPAARTACCSTRTSPATRASAAAATAWPRSRGDNACPPGSTSSSWRPLAVALAFRHAARALGARRAAVEMLALAAYGFALEAVAIAVFASHRYDASWRLAPLGVPLAVALVWAAVIVAAMAVAWTVWRALPAGARGHRGARRAWP